MLTILVDKRHEKHGFQYIIFLVKIRSLLSLLSNFKFPTFFFVSPAWRSGTWKEIGNGNPNDIKCVSKPWPGARHAPVT